MTPPLSHSSRQSITSESVHRRVGPVGRGILVLWSVVLAGGLTLAGGLEPDPRGFGTHERLGLPPCSFQMMFGLPCPSCGMTTSFANFSRGRILQSARANPAGLLLAAFCLVQIPWCWISAFRGRLWRISQPERCLLWGLVVLIGACLAQWGVRLAGAW